MTPKALLATLLLSGPLLAESPSAAPPQTLQQRLTLVQAQALRRKDFTVSLSQDRFSSLRRKTTHSEGKLSYSPPKLFRWEFTSPQKEIYVNNGKDFWKYVESTRHAQRLSPDTPELDFLDVLLNLNGITDQWKVDAWKPSGTLPPKDPILSLDPPEKLEGKLALKLTPLKDSREEALYVLIDEKSAFVDNLLVVSKNGDRIRITLSNLNLSKVENARFDFTPPPGTAIDKGN